MAITEDRKLKGARKPGFGIGLLKGMGVTIKHLFKRNVVIEYPDEKQDLPARTRGVIALKEENCTVCMLCARECPDWCIYIDSHKETLPPKREGGRQRKRNVLDRFAIDYALCMYCGICVEVCPYDALFWSREFEYAEYDIRELTHEKERLSDWMATVLPPPPLEEGAEIPGQVARGTVTAAAPAAPAPAQAAPAAPAPAPAPAAPAPTQAAPAAPAPAPATEAPTPTPAAPIPAPTPEAAKAEAPVEKTAEAPPTEEAPKAEAPAAAATEATVQVPHEEPHPTPLEQTEDPEAVYQQVLEEQRSKGASPQVAEARAKVARVKAERGIKRAAGATAPPVEVQPQAPDPGHATEPEPSGAPEAKAIEPEPGPVAPAAEAQTTEAPAADAQTTEAPAAEAQTTETPAAEAEAPAPEAAAPAPEAEAPAAPAEPAAAAEPTAPEPAAAEPEAPEAAAPPEPEAKAEPPAQQASGEDPEAVYESVLEAEREKGSAEAVAVARAKAARARAQRGMRRPRS